jgi:hypothetical protein
MPADSAASMAPKANSEQTTASARTSVIAASTSAA